MTKINKAEVIFWCKKKHFKIISSKKIIHIEEIETSRFFKDYSHSNAWDWFPTKQGHFNTATPPLPPVFSDLICMTPRYCASAAAAVTSKLLFCPTRNVWNAFKCQNIKAFPCWLFYQLTMNYVVCLQLNWPGTLISVRLWNFKDLGF